MQGKDLIAFSVGSGGMSEPLPTGTVTFLFSDIEGSTRLVGELEEPVYRELIEQHHRLLREVFSAHGGTERGTQGDGFLVVFSDAPSAVAAAVEGQRSLAAAVWPSGVEVRVRMGLHSGRGVPGGDDYIGIDINRASRIASLAHGGQVLISDSTRALAERSLPKGVAVRDVGELRLKGLDQPERIYQLTIEGLRSHFPTPVGRSGPVHLPARITSFVGRRAELDRLRLLLSESRLVTLLGPGGSGKTSLAVELAREVADDFADGLWFVDLAPLADPSLVEPTVAHRLGISEQPGQSIREEIEAYLSARQGLLVLDNFEHLLAAVEMVTALLAAAPGLKVLATSRRGLDLYGEQRFDVPPLGLPDIDAWADHDTLARSEAVTLFVERAGAVRPGFSLSDDNAPAVGKICLRLDGLPLAIELAASRLRLLTPSEILERLEQHLPVLGATPRGRPSRQQTLEATIEWSYELLSEMEKGLFARLAIFAGGFTLEAAEAVCDPDGELGFDVFDGISSLVDQSLVQHVVEAADRSRFGMLETIRDYGRHRLEESGLESEIGRRHLRYYRDQVEATEPHLLGPDPTDWVDRLDAEFPNLRAALRHALQSADIESGLRLAASLWRFWFQRGYLREGRSWLEELLAVEPDAHTPARAKGYTALGGLAYWLTDPEATESAYQSALDIHRELGDKEGEAEAMYNLAFVPAMTNQHQEARKRFEASMAAAKDAGASGLVAKNQIPLGIAATTSGDPHAAVDHLEEALNFFRQDGDSFHVAWATGALGKAYLALGRIDEARQASLDALQLRGAGRNVGIMGAGLNDASALASSAGRHTEAMRLAGAAETLREETGASAPLPLRVQADVETTARQAIGDEAVDRALTEGRNMTLDEAIAYAVSIIESPDP